MARRLVFRPLARDDLEEIEQFIAAYSPKSAREFVESIKKRCESLLIFPEQGRARDDLHIGLRMMAYDRRVVVVYRFDADTVDIVRVFYGGRDYETLLRGADEE